MTVYILEGPDGAGKSTLADHIAGHLDNTFGDYTEQWHYGPFTKDRTAIQEYLGPLSEWVDRFGNHEPGSSPNAAHLIIDRFHIGELIYGPMFRGKSKLSVVERGEIDAYLASIDAVLIYVATDFETLEKRFLDRGDDFVAPTQLYTIWSTYNSLLSSHSAWINWTPEHSRIF